MKTEHRAHSPFSLPCISIPMQPSLASQPSGMIFSPTHRLSLFNAPPICRNWTCLLLAGLLCSFTLLLFLFLRPAHWPMSLQTQVASAFASHLPGASLCLLLLLWFYRALPTPYKVDIFPSIVPPPLEPITDQIPDSELLQGWWSPHFCPSVPIMGSST